MRLDVKIAIIQSGRRQYQIAHEAGLSEGRLSRVLFRSGSACGQRKSFGCGQF